MITLIGHGYIGQAIAKKLAKQNWSYRWIGHQDHIPEDTQIIINAAGFTGSPNVDACEIHKQETINGNVIWPLHLENNFPNIPIVHISSGCIYTGYKDSGWTEEDEPNFDFNNGSFYSGSKALGQKVLEPFMNKSYLLRIRMPFGNEVHPKNFLTKMSRYQKLISYENSLSHIEDVADFAIFCATEQPTPGIYNVCNPGSSNAKEIIKMMGIEKEWFTEEEFKKSVVAPRSNCVLNVDKIMKIFPLKSVKERLLESINAMKG